MESIQVRQVRPRLHNVQPPIIPLHHLEDARKYTVTPQASEIVRNQIENVGVMEWCSVVVGIILVYYYYYFAYI